MRDKPHVVLGEWRGSTRRHFVFLLYLSQTLFEVYVHPISDPHVAERHAERQWVACTDEGWLEAVSSACSSHSRQTGGTISRSFEDRHPDTHGEAALFTQRLTRFRSVLDLFLAKVDGVSRRVLFYTTPLRTSLCEKTSVCECRTWRKKKCLCKNLQMQQHGSEKSEPPLYCVPVR